MDKIGDWQQVDLGGGAGFAVPANARRASGTTVDSRAGWFEGDGFRITFDLGRFGERPDMPGDAGAVRSATRIVAGRPAVEVAFEPDDEPFAWARLLYVDLGSNRSLTIRVSCDDIDRCAFAETLFESIVLPVGA